MAGPRQGGRPLPGPAQDGAVHTAGDGVLEGTVRRLVLEVCAADGIPVVLEPPRLDAASTWVGAFLSSTSRLVMPIDELRYASSHAAAAAGDLDSTVSFRPGACSVLTALEARVLAEVARHSDPLPTVATVTP